MNQADGCCTIFSYADFQNNEGGIAALIYDGFGKLQHVECEAISALNPLEAELQAIRSGLWKALELGWKICHIFSDCKVAVKAISLSSPPPEWTVWHVYFDILNLVVLFNNFSIAWIPRKSNNTADRVSSWVMKTNFKGTFVPFQIPILEDKDVTLPFSV